MEKMYRQGDVLLVRCESLPVKVKRLDTNVVAHGEQTGHMHRIEVDAGDCVLVEAENGDMYVSVKGKATLKHDEHGPLALETGHYKVVRQREYSPEAIKKVAD